MMMHNNGLTKKNLLLTLIAVVFTISNCVVEAQFDGANFGQPKICPTFKCSKDQEPVPKWPYRVKSMGCASSSGGMMAMQPSKMGGEDPLEDCCHAKQVCLQTCGSVKHLCQEDFMKCGDRTCAAIGSSKDREDCTRTIELQKMLSGMDTCNEYDNYQRQNCKCVAKDDAPKERAKFLTRFYEKYNPEDVSKAKKLATKADTVRKMATLVGKLVQKYPKAIKIIEDPNKAMMDKIMKESKEEKKDNKEEDESTAEDMGTEEL